MKILPTIVCHSDRSRSACDGGVEEPAFSFPDARVGTDAFVRPPAGPGGGRLHAPRRGCHRLVEETGQGIPDPRQPHPRSRTKLERGTIGRVDRLGTKSRRGSSNLGLHGDFVDCLRKSIPTLFSQRTQKEDGTLGFRSRSTRLTLYRLQPRVISSITSQR